MALPVSRSFAAFLTSSDIVVADVDHSAVLALFHFHLHLSYFSDCHSQDQSQVVAASANSGPSAASALSLETAASVDGSRSASPDQCAPSAPFDCSVERSSQSVAAAYSVDADSSAVRTGPAVEALSLQAAGAATATANTVPYD